MAGRPFFMVTSWAFAISFFALHFTQYASATVFASLGFEFLLRKPRPYLTGTARQASRCKTVTEIRTLVALRGCFPSATMLLWVVR
jgi:hypothetical protein